MIAITQFSFTIAHMGFIIGSFKSTIDDIFEVNTNPYLYSWLLMCILTPLACVRNIAKFSFTFLIGVLMILISFFVVSIFCFKEIYDSGHVAEGTQMFNSTNFSLAIGFSIFNFEGIGVVMPIMKRTKEPKKFKRQLILALATIITLYIIFGEVCYFTYGNSMDSQIITEQMPPGNLVVKLVKVFISINLIFTYAISINPTNTIL
jgi:proton-coupled amino acid transporter